MDTSREPEVWKDIPGYEGEYQLSSWGNVKSMDRYRPAKAGILHFHKGKIININYAGDYPQICLSKNNKKKSYRLHRLMVLVFYKREIENMFGSYVVNHKDLNKNNNYYKNLEVISRRGNSSHYFKNSYEKTSSFIGVSYDKSKPKYPWVASAFHLGKTIKLGNFIEEIEAKKAYDSFLKSNNFKNEYK